MIVKVYDNKGINFVIKSENALTVVNSLLHSIKANFIVIDLTHADTDKGKDADYVIVIDT